MNRFTKFTVAALVAVLTFTACDEGTPPPVEPPPPPTPVGTISGSVTIEGTAASGVTATLSSGATTTTGSGGNFAFSGVEAGTYTVTISGFPEDATFAQVTQSATIATDGQNVQLNFAGEYIRSSAVVGNVVAADAMMSGGDGQPETLVGVTVTLDGEHAMGETMETGMDGGFAFTGLRAGTYTVTISDFPEDVSFETVSVEVEVDVGDVGQADFTGHYIRTSAVEGQVVIEGEGLPGVTVVLSGGPADESYTTMTDADGMYRFEELRPGDYTVSIDGFDPRDYEFAATSDDVSVNLDETATVDFTGTLLRTSGIAGRVSVSGMGLGGVTVTLSGADGEQSTETDATGQYAIAGLAAGDYTVTISGYDAVEYAFEDSQSVTLEMDATAIVNFAGTPLRTASLTASVTADGEGVAGAGVTLVHVTGATSGNVLGVQATGADGTTTFGPLLAGVYRVEISVDSDEIDFEATSWQGEVATGEAAMASFAGSINRTASISGSVTVDGEGMSGVAVMLSGGEGDQSAETGDDGSYSFSGLRKGDYTVSITNPDEARYEFTSTSESVSLAVGQSQSVSFAGSMVRASSISGTVSVEGSGVEGVTVTLSGAKDAEATTDAGGLYSFTGLGAGDYTVAITLSDEQAAAYVFEADDMSMSVTLGDSDNQTVNFTGKHDTSASFTAMLFIDEATKNDEYDEGEDAFPSAAMLQALQASQAPLPPMLPVPVTLSGPGVNEMRSGVLTLATGQVSFSDLRAGTYLLQVGSLSALLEGLPAPVQAVLQDYEYGGPTAGYTVEIGAGEAATQAVPVDITHTTAHFSVTLRHGDDAGDAVAGATVTLHSGDTMVGSGETGETGLAMIRFARAGTSGNMVNASVAVDGYHVAEGMTAVMWDPKISHTQGTNANDIVNLNVDVSFSGATVPGPDGERNDLPGWAVSVMHGEDAVEGAPEMLDDDGNASFETTVEADDLPATFTVAVADDQDDDLDGGESYGAQAVEYEHDGLSLAGNQDAGMIEVAFTTQTLKVFVHNERDQVEGYTGNILGSDQRDGEGDDRKVSVGIRYIDSSGRSRSFEASDSISEPDDNGDGGAWVFNNVPADHNVIVQAAKADQADASIMLLTYSNAGGMHNDELSTYENLDQNGVTGGAFGAMGGSSHTVSLCPLQAIDPTGQNHGECASFAYVNTHSVSGLIWKNEVLRSTDGGANDDAFLMGPEDDEGPTFVPGISISLSPVDGKNLAGDAESATTTEDPVRGLGETSAGTEVLDETHQFAFNNIAAGVYKYEATDGWRVRMGIKGAEDMVRDALNPLDGDVSLDVTPATTTVYGYVRDSEDFPVVDVTVNVNGVAAVSDVHGRYIAEYVGPETRKIGSTTHRNSIFVETAHEGNVETRDIVAFAANSRINQDVELGGVGRTASISGTVTASGTGAPIAGAEIKVDGGAPENAATKGTNKGKLVTGADGSYTAVIAAKDVGQTAVVTVSADGWSFVPGVQTVPAHGGAEISGINFTGFLHARITGRVRGPDSLALGGVEVTATNVTDDEATEVSSTSNARGTFVLSVPFGVYDITATLANHIFAYPNDNQRVSTAPGQTLDYGDIRAKTAMARNVTATRLSGPVLVDGDSVMRYGDIRVTFVADSTAIPLGYSTPPVYTVQTNTGTNGAWEAQTSVGDSLADGIAEFASPHDTTLMVRVLATLSNDDTVDPQHGTALPLPSAVRTVTAVDPSASNVKARIGVTADTLVADTLVVTWDATSNNNSDYRIAVQLAPADLGGQTFWFLATGGEPSNPGANTRAWTLETPAPGLDNRVTWTIINDDGTIGTTARITSAELSAATMVRVESVQGTPSDDNPWKASAAVAVTGGS